MSNWTHVAAVARIDGWPGDKTDFQSIFGREWGYDDDLDDWDEMNDHPDRFLPMGSEGSCRMSVWVNPDHFSLARYTVTIFGDLRDHDDPAAVVAWFKSKLKNLLVRQAAITVENERFDTVSWVYTPDENRKKGNR